jgi:hypothetical protein
VAAGDGEAAAAHPGGNDDRHRLRAHRDRLLELSAGDKDRIIRLGRAASVDLGAGDPTRARVAGARRARTARERPSAGKSPVTCCGRSGFPMAASSDDPFEYLYNVTLSQCTGLRESKSQ